MQRPPAGFVLAPGVSGAGAVFEIERAGTVFVCKRLPPRARVEAWMRERLAAEGRLLARLGGHGTPVLVDAGEDEEGPWLVMERVPHATLSTRIGRAEVGWIERAARASFDVLATLHEAGVVHADLSPDNVLVSDAGNRAAIIDFGLARAADMPPLPPGPFRGTLVYAAPELARGESFGGRADCFALAASLLHVASGRPPRTAPGEAAMLLAAAEEPIDAWARSAAARLDPALGEALVACCAFDASRRADRLGEAPRLP